MPAGLEAQLAFHFLSVSTDLLGWTDSLGSPAKFSLWRPWRAVKCFTVQDLHIVSVTKHMLIHIVLILL